MSAVEDQAAALRERHGERWQIWYVPLALGGYTNDLLDNVFTLRAQVKF